MTFVNTFDLIGQFIDHKETCPIRSGSRVVEADGTEINEREAMCNCGVAQARTALASVKDKYSKHATTAARVKDLQDGLDKAFSNVNDSKGKVLRDVDAVDGALKIATKMAELLVGVNKIVTSRREAAKRLVLDGPTQGAAAQGTLSMCTSIDQLFIKTFEGDPWTTSSE